MTQAVEVSEDMVCKFCQYHFVRRSSFENHICDNMRKEDAASTMTGKTAYALYTQWMTHRRMPVPDLESFIYSKLYTAFLRFVVFVNRAKLPQPGKFVKFAAERGYVPIIWERDQIYLEYLDYLDALSPLEQTEATARHIFKWCEDKGIETKEYFDYIHPNEFTHHVQMRWVYPWGCIAMDRFRTYFIEDMGVDHKMIVERIFKIDQLYEALDNDVASLEAAREIADILGL